jgi:hypothetical protein
MREAQTSPFDKTEPPVAEWRASKNQKARFSKNGKTGFLSFKFLTPTGC